MTQDSSNNSPLPLPEVAPADTRIPQWVAAVIAILYGFAKINGSQFTILDSELTRPMGEVSGFWLTWYYFGYSTAYGTLLALVQIGGGVLIVLPRSKLLGALILLPLALNVVLIDIFYGVDLGGLGAALVLLVCVLMTLGPHARRLRAAVFPQGLSSRPSNTTVVALVMVLTGAFAFTWWVANYNNRVPTAIDGVWTVTGRAGPDGGLHRVFFERNRARMVVFRTRNGTDTSHHFEVEADGTLRIWERWLEKGDIIMEGRLVGPTTIELVRVRDRERLVLTRAPDGR
jgi:hypothetical protein